MSNLSNRSQVKADFFENEIIFISQLKNNLNNLLNHTKKSLLDNKSTSLHARIKTIHRTLRRLTDAIQKDAIQTKIHSNLQIDAQRIEETQFFQSYDSKIQELNDKLILSESLVQQAQNIKKQLDRNKSQYEQKKYKAFRQRREQKYIEKNMNIRYHLNAQISRTIHLLNKIQDLSKKPNLLNKQMTFLAEVKINQIGYRQYRGLVHNLQIKNRPKSQGKYIRAQVFDQKQNMIEKLIKSQSYQLYFSQALSQETVALKEKNRKNRILNRQLAEALEKKNKQSVLKHLNNKQQLDYEESLAKIQIQAQNLYQNIQQRLLALLSYKKRRSKSFLISHQTFPKIFRKLSLTKQINKNYQPQKIDTISSS